MAKKQKKQIVCSQHPANLLNIKDVASLLSVSTDTVRRYLRFFVRLWETIAKFLGKKLPNG